MKCDWNLPSCPFFFFCLKPLSTIYSSHLEISRLLSEKIFAIASAHFSLWSLYISTYTQQNTIKENKLTKELFFAVLPSLKVKVKCVGNVKLNFPKGHMSPLCVCHFPSAHFIKIKAKIVAALSVLVAAEMFLFCPCLTLGNSTFLNRHSLKFQIWRSDNYALLLASQFEISSS